MKRFNLAGTVDRLQKENVTKRQTEGVGENKITRVVEGEGFTAVILGTEGQRIRLTQDDPFDFTVGEDVRVTVEYGVQTKLDDDHERKPKKKA